MTQENAKHVQARYDQIEGEAFEGYLVDVIRGWAAEQERLGYVSRARVADVKLVGEGFPHWGCIIETVDPDSGERGSSKFPFRGKPNLFEAEKRARDVIIGDLLMEIREGG